MVVFGVGCMVFGVWWVVGGICFVFWSVLFGVCFFPVRKSPTLEKPITGGGKRARCSRRPHARPFVGVFQKLISIRFVNF